MVVHVFSSSCARSALSLLAGLAMVTTACGSEDQSPAATPTELEVAGTWTTDFGTEVLTTADWNGSAIVRYDNKANVAFTQNSATASWSPNKFNKLVWTQPSGTTFYYCTVSFDHDTLALAEASTQTADSADLTGKGCGGFAWTLMTRK